MSVSVLSARLEHLIFTYRSFVIGIFMLVTFVMLYFSCQLKIDAGFTKLLPLEHEFMETFLKYREDFGGANRILVALVVKQGDIFTAKFFETLRKATDEVFFIPGIDRSRVRSLFTPNTRFTEVVENGISGGNVIPYDFQPTPEGLAKVRENIFKAQLVGRLVANDFTGAIISAQLMDFNPNTGKRLDYVEVSRQLEDKIRQRFEQDGITVHIIGFAKVVGDITTGAQRAVGFFAITFLLTALLVFVYSQSFRITIVTLGCSLTAVIWQLGLLPLLGYGMDPISILVPFLVFAIGVSHGVQMISATGSEIFSGADSLMASRRSFRRLLVPSCVALLSDTIGFVTILLIEVEIIQEMAVAASLGVALIILTNLILLPVLLSYFPVDDAYRTKLHLRSLRISPFWRIVARVAEPRAAHAVIVVSGGLLGFGLWQGTDVKIGDLNRGVPELRSDSRYNIDSQIISDKFSIGVDVLSVIVETVPEGCVQYEIMDSIDRFAWYMRNVEGVRSVISLPGVVKIINAGWNEGGLKWRVLPRNQHLMAQSLAHVPTSSGLLNSDCSAMPVLIFTADHKAETIERIVAAVERFQSRKSSEQVDFMLAAGNVGVMAATNEEVEAAQFQMLSYVFSAVALLCLLSFRSIGGMLCVLIPLALVSLLSYALMNCFGIGLKVNTLPVVALGVGVGVDYGIYIYSRMSDMLSKGVRFAEAYLRTLTITGNGVVFTGITMTLGVATWIFSPLQFQADMGILLTFMFLVNMLGAIVLLPALAYCLISPVQNSASRA